MKRLSLGFLVFISLLLCSCQSLKKLNNDINKSFQKIASDNRKRNAKAERSESAKDAKEVVKTEEELDEK